MKSTGSWDNGLVIISVFLIGLFLMTACTGEEVRSLWGRDGPSEEYLRILERWTDHGTVYQDFEAKIHVSGTYKSSVFREAFVREYSRGYHLSPIEEAEMLAMQETMAEKNIEFLLAVSAPNKRENHLDARDSAWRMYLENEYIGRLKPKEIRRIRPSKRTARSDGYYPYISPWAEVYQVRFESQVPPPPSGELRLVITGILGAVHLVYQLGD